MEHYDICIIGAGPSGYAAAMRAIDFKKKVILIDKNRVGGAGVFNGALSSKTLWELSENYRNAHDSNFGFRVYESELRYSEIIAEMNKAVNERYKQLKFQLDYYIQKGMMRFEKAEASFKGMHEIELKSDDQKETISADNIVLAIGSRPRKLPNIPVDEETIVTSDGISNFTDFPESMVILGAGVIGCEFATIFSNFGCTAVHMIDKQNRILPFEDRDLSDVVGSNLKDHGVLVHHESSLQRMEIKDGLVEYELEYNDGRREIYNVEKALLSVGRVPNYENLGLEEIGVHVNERGYAEDKDTKTSIDHIYAVGDFTADVALVNIAELEGRHAIEKICENTKRELSYENVSSIMFLNPAIGTVGLNEQQARKQKIPYKVATYQYQYVNRAIAMRKKTGFFKILVTDDEEMRILGMRVLGAHASSTIEAVALLIHMKKGIRELAELVHPHPSITEGVQECVRMFLNNSIIKPYIFKKHQKCYRYTKEGRIVDLYPS